MGRWRPVFFGEAGVCASNGQDGGGPIRARPRRAHSEVYIRIRTFVIEVDVAIFVQSTMHGQYDVSTCVDPGSRF